MIRALAHRISNFLSTESSLDALRNILAILLPSLLIYYVLDGHFAVACAVGILLAALTDLPGNKADKYLTATYAIPIFFISSFLTATALHEHSWTIVPLLGIFGFLFTIIALLGFRINVVGNLGLIVASFTIGLRPADPMEFSLTVTAAAILYFAISLIQVHLFPYQSLRFAVAGGIQQMANLIRLKVDCYNPEKSLNQVYKDLSALHLKLSDQLEALRGLLLRDKKLQQETDSRSKLWLAKLYQLIDLYELLMAVDHDYDYVRERLGKNGSLDLIQRALTILSQETAALTPSRSPSILPESNRVELQQIITDLERIAAQENPANRDLLASICKQLIQITGILQNLKVKTIQADNSWLESHNFKDFVAPKTGFQTIWKNLSFKSPLFSYAIRMAILLMAGGMIGYFLPEYRYASWILLTIILVARPSYTTTQKRNYQRIIGSLIGIAISLLILLLIKDQLLLLIIAAICLYLFLLFNRPNYMVCVIFITICILLGQHMYESNLQDMLGSRFAFTLLGSIFAVLGCLAIPINHYRSIEQQTSSLIQHFRTYLQKIQEGYSSQDLNYYDLRLLRKFTQASLAQSYDALEQFANEPIKGKIHQADIIHLQTLAYRINALLVGLSIQMTKLDLQLQPALMQERMNYVEQLIEETESLSKKLSKAGFIEATQNLKGRRFKQSRS